MAYSLHIPHKNILIFNILACDEERSVNHRKVGGYQYCETQIQRFKNTQSFDSYCLSLQLDITWRKYLISCNIEQGQGL